VQEGDGWSRAAREALIFLGATTEEEEDHDEEVILLQEYLIFAQFPIEYKQENVPEILNDS
jgi:hypothetical protein